mmetsp:Transcript_25321/g.68803  ORF Transcript_25321/g.68803 Transcript_25321/m.68803 type:complete len:212 (+) Transcript_25321:579-1214(+)
MIPGQPSDPMSLPRSEPTTVIGKSASGSTNMPAAPPAFLLTRRRLRLLFSRVLSKYCPKSALLSKGPAVSSSRRTSSCTCGCESTRRTSTLSTAYFHNRHPGSTTRAFTSSANLPASAPPKSNCSVTTPLLLLKASTRRRQQRVAPRKSRRSRRSSRKVCVSLRATSLRARTSMAALTAALSTPKPPGKSPSVPSTISAAGGEPWVSKSRM